MPMVSPMLALADPVAWLVVETLSEAEEAAVLWWLLDFDPALWMWGWY